MRYSLKYIRFRDDNDNDYFVIFSGMLNHSDIASFIVRNRVKSDLVLLPFSAGFIDWTDGVAYTCGHSYSLSLRPDENDSNFINNSGVFLYYDDSNLLLYSDSFKNVYDFLSTNIESTTLIAYVNG